MANQFGTIPQLPSTSTITNNTIGGLNAAIPGFSNLSSSASSQINSLLGGLPSTAPSRLENAWYGSGTGLNPTSEFLNNRGYDLYRMNSMKYRQQGLEDYLKTLGTVSGTAAPTAAQVQEQGNTQAVYNAAPDPQQANNYALELFNKYMKPPGQPWWASSAQPNVPTTTRTPYGAFAV